MKALFEKSLVEIPKVHQSVSLVKLEKIALNEYNRPNAWAYSSLYLFIYLFFRGTFYEMFLCPGSKLRTHSC